MQAHDGLGRNKTAALPNFVERSPCFGWCWGVFKSRPRAGQLLMSLPRPLWMLPVWFSSLTSLPCLARAPSAADAAQRKNPARLTCQELSAAFYQLLCIPPLSPPAASHDLPKKKFKKNERFRGGGVSCAQSLACAEDRTLQVPPSLWPWGPGWQLFAF